MHLNELKALHVSEVLKQAEDLEIENTGRMRKQELMFAIIKKRARAGEQIFADGVLEILPDGFGFLRSPDTSYTASTDDIYISPSQVRRFNLHTGDMIEGEVRTPKDGERYFALNKLEKVNGGGPEENKHKVMFENLTPLFPKEQMRLEREIKSEENITGRIIDIIAPIGKGQRALLVAPPKSGKTVMMQHIAHAIAANYPNSHMMVLLVDERPTIIATALVDTGSRMDEVIFEEFKGTGNSEIHLDRRLYEKRVFPSIQLNRSGTRREELLLQPEILQKTRILRQFLYNMDEIESMEMVLKQMKATKTNSEFFELMRRGG
jgi:transcription termination factor Rho